MQRISFYQLPLAVRLAVPVTFFNTWVWIAEFASHAPARRHRPRQDEAFFARVTIDPEAGT